MCLFVCLYVCLSVCLSVCVDVCCQLFVKSLLLLQFSLILTKLGIHDLCANTQKTLHRIFQILILKFTANFLNFEFGLSLSNSLN